jgi:hypothetical protein
LIRRGVFDIGGNVVRVLVASAAMVVVFGPLR